jgi:hypothetical protein
MHPDRAPRTPSALPWVGIYAKTEWEALLRDFPGDFIGPGPVLAPGDRVSGTQARKGIYVDEWGCPFEAAEDGVIGEVKRPPLADWSAFAHFRPPYETIERADWDAVNRAQKANLAGPRKFMVAGTSIRPFERMQFLRGSENLYLDLACGTRDLVRLRDMVHEFYMRELVGWVKTDCDSVAFMDDWGSQQSLLINPGMWRELFKPMYKDYCYLIRAAGKKVFMHSDGCIDAIYPDLVEVGVDAMNSQLFTMDIEDLGRRFRGRVTFNGEIDRQWALPFGTVLDVRRAVGRVRRALDDGRGGVIAQCEWGVRTPPENVRAVYQAWTEPIENLP